MLGAIAEFETEILSERQLDGIHKAKELGVRFGRKQLLSASQVTEVHLKHQNRKNLTNVDWNLQQIQINDRYGL
jgi:DNA invertase Pin-like site-specific DNA recombinase